MWTTAVRFGHTVTHRDTDGFRTETVTWGVPVRASMSDITRQDQTLAMQGGYNLDVNVTVHKANFDGAHFLQDVATGDIYDIQRTYKPEKSMTIVLSCSKRERGKDGAYGTEG